MDAPSPTIDPALGRRRRKRPAAGPKSCKARRLAVWQRRPGPGDARPDVIVTDLAEIDAGAAAIRPWSASAATARPTCGCRPIALPRELTLACELLAQIVRLRRRERQAAEIHRELSAQAMSDPLTGLPNRRAWDLALTGALAVAAAEARDQLCLAILDLDHFKHINDLHGHVVGDEVLRASGRAIYDHLRQDDFVARLGGDEFGLLVWVPDDGRRWRSSSGCGPRCPGDSPAPACPR